ncbi:MAG: hypothetical protein V4659_13600 [Pseudomonadota bacterium]
MTASDLATGAPVWVWVLLAALILLGVRRLRTREVPVAVAALPSVAFLSWSLSGAWLLAQTGGAPFAALAWLGGAALGALSTLVLAEPRGVRRPGGRVLLPATRLPLILYLLVFAARFACGAWAALRPDHALTADTIATVISAAMTARLIVAVARWQRPERTGMAA